MKIVYWLQSRKADKEENLKSPVQKNHGGSKEEIMEKDSGKLFGNFVAAGLKDLKDFVKKAATEGSVAAKKVVDKALYSFDLSSDEIKEQLNEIKNDLSGIMTDAKMDSIIVTLRNISFESQVKLIGRLSVDNQKQIAALSSEMKDLIFHCTRLLDERSKMIFPKVRTVKDLDALLQRLGLAIDLGSYPAGATVIGTEKKKGDDLLVDFYLERGDYGRKMVRLVTISATQLYK